MKIKDNITSHFIKYILIFSVILFTSCTEQYVLQSNTFEDILVVNGIITNELRLQEIKVNRTYRLEENKPVFEKGANVYITDNDNTVYEFEEDVDSYISKSAFKAIPGKKYQLNIITKDGKSYSSTPEILTPESEVQVTPIVQTNEGEKGVNINVSSYDPTGQSKFYRYEYDETYKIIAPYWNPNKYIIAPYLTPDGDPDFLVVPRTGETRTCYTTKSLDDLTLKSTVGLTEDRINFPIRYISVKDPILRERYSIIVRQYVQNLASYTYYKTLKDLSISKSILSQTQTGFNYGNLKCNDNPNEKIVGYFEVSSVSSKRIFFNFIDIFPKEANYPPYFIKCNTIEKSNCFKEKGCGGAFIEAYVNSVFYVYYGSTDDNRIYTFVEADCGDCTKFSSNIKPLFWID
ncbi:DUF4249 domain-containing protein [Flavobacterium aestivum]|uniref:DUF4249 domain-containing protein n=1 Tax=Flavobacterium aestivum TaxID=3003257 RepID=UPI002482D773|nr:DUF4249 domain-containing protein [Flavobacterium aestivum]